LQVIIHYIPLAVVAKRLLRNKKFLGHQYHGYEIQYSERNPGARAIGRSNSTLWFETAQARADYFMHANGDSGQCRVAGLITCSDGSYGGKFQGWHGVYGTQQFMYSTCTQCVLCLYLSCTVLVRT